MKKIKIVLSLVICLAIVLGTAPFQFISVDAANKSVPVYVALGDSITSGFGLSSFNNNDTKNKTNPDNYVVKLGKKLGTNTFNLGIEGYDSTQLLQLITTPSSKQKADIERLKTASLITVSVGGNNVLIPLINAVNRNLGSGKSIYTADPSEVQIAVLSLLFNQEALNDLQNELNSSVLKFTGDTKQKKTGEFVAIINRLKKLNPKAQIIVQTIYNPYTDFLPQVLSDYIKSMNSAIINGSSSGKNYKVADVASAFEKAGEGTVLVNADSGETFDPHPTAKGHNVIYTLMVYAATNKLPYNVKASVAKGKVTSKVTQGNVVFTVTPDKGYKVPKSISITIGKSPKKTVALKNGTASMPVADVGADITVSGACMK